MAGSLSSIRLAKGAGLVLGTVESYYRRHIILGKRFGKLTNYLMIEHRY